MLLVPKQFKRVGMTGSVALLRRPTHACPGLRGVPSVSAAADFCGSHDDWGRIRPRACTGARRTNFPAQPQPDAQLALQQLWMQA